MLVICKAKAKRTCSTVKPYIDLIKALVRYAKFNSKLLNSIDSIVLMYNRVNILPGTSLVHTLWRMLILKFP